MSQRTPCLPWWWFAPYVTVVVIFGIIVVVLVANGVTPELAIGVPAMLSGVAAGALSTMARARRPKQP